MKYVAKVEIEFETEGDPIGPLHSILERTRRLLCTQIDEGPLAEHYHIIELPRELGNTRESEVTPKDDPKTSGPLHEPEDGDHESW